MCLNPVRPGSRSVARSSTHTHKLTYCVQLGHDPTGQMDRTQNSRFADSFPCDYRHFLRAAGVFRIFFRGLYCRSERKHSRGACRVCVCRRDGEQREICAAMFRLGDFYVYS